MLPNSPFHLLFQPPGKEIIYLYVVTILIPGMRTLEADGIRLPHLLNVALKAVDTDEGKIILSKVVVLQCRFHV